MEERYFFSNRTYAFYLFFSDVSHFVIPVKTGIHDYAKPCFSFWIPAYAGMTEEIKRVSPIKIKKTFVNFFVWHYTKGVVSAVGIMRDFLWFVLDFFSAEELSEALFSVWQRDASRPYARRVGFVRNVCFFLENLFLRVVGSGARLLVIGAGMCVFVLVFSFFLCFLVVWIIFPAVLLAVFGAVFIQGKGEYFLLVPGMLIPLVFSSVGYSGFCREALRKETDRFLQKRWWRRALGRCQVFLSPEAIEDIRTPEELSEVLQKQYASKEDFERAIEWELFLDRDAENRRAFWRRENVQKIRPIARRWRIGLTPHVDQYGCDFPCKGECDDARVCVHGRELESVNMILTRSKRSCAMLVAPAGSGKRSLIRFLAKHDLEQDGRMFFHRMRWVNIDLKRVLAAQEKGVRGRNILENIFREAVTAGNCVLVLENIDRYFEKFTRRAYKTEISPVLAKYAAMPNFRCIATVSTQGFYASVEHDETLLKLFEVVELDPTDEGKAFTVLLDECDGVGDPRVPFTFSALRKIIQHSFRLYPATALPERALDVAREVIAYERHFPSGEYITEKTVDDFFSFRTGVSLKDMRISEEEKRAHLEYLLSERIVGQPELAKRVVRAFGRAQTKKHRDTRPIATFLFLGPSGSGKTELADIVCKTYFGKAGTMFYLDMNNYQSDAAADQCIGFHKANVPGQLSLRVRSMSNGVLFLDNFEKANSRIRDIFAQIFEEGFFTDSFGKKISCAHLIFIAASGAGAGIVKKRLAEGASVDAVRKEVMQYTVERNVFRAEFFNHFDEVILFHSVEGENLLKACRVFLHEVARRIKQNGGIAIEFDEDVYPEVIRRGYDSAYGTDSIKRFVTKTVGVKIEEILATKNPGRGEKIRVIKEDLFF